MIDPVGHIVETVGEPKVLELVAAFYGRVADDALLRPLYPEVDLGPAETRLADFLVGRFGGDQRYTLTRGHPRLRMRHAPFVVDQANRDRWMELMTAAAQDVDFPEPTRGQMLTFLDGVASFLLNR